MKTNKNDKNNENRKLKTFKEAVASFEWHRAGVLFLSTVVSIALYYTLNNLWGGVLIPYVIGLYVAAAGTLILAYFIYNRAFTGRGVTYEMLPDAMSDAEKRKYLADVAERERKSRWIIMVIFPIIIPLMIDMLKIFVIDQYFTKQ